MKRATPEKASGLESCDACQRIIEVMNVGAFVQKADGSFVTINQAALEMVGLSREEFFDRAATSPTWEVIDETRKPVLPGDFPSNEALRTGLPVKGRIMAVRHAVTGQFTWLEINAEPQFAGHKKHPAFVVVTWHDITRQKIAGDILNARLRLLEYNQSHTLDELFVETLNELEVITGSRIGFFHLVMPDQQTLFLQAWSTATTKDYCTATGKGLHYGLSEAGVWADCIRQKRAVVYNDYASLSHRRGLPEGHAAVNRLISVPVFTEKGIVAVIGVGNKDTYYTERDLEMVALFADLAWQIASARQVQLELTAQEARLQAMFNLTGVAFLVLDPKGKIGDCNQRFADLMEFRREDLLGLPAPDIIHPDDRMDFNGQFNDLIAGRVRFFRIQLRCITRTTDDLWMDLSVTPVMGAAGQCESVLAAGSDINQQKDSEAALNQKIDELEKFNEIAVGRELVMIGLKKEVNALLHSMGEDERYRIVESEVP